MENKEFIEKYFDSEDKYGFNDVLYKREQKLEAIRERLKKYELSDSEVDELFKIIINSEIEMEKIKRGFKTKNYSQKDLDKFYDKLIEIQNKMKENFDKKLNMMLKNKYEAAKKILEERKKKS